jgi:hypothetical protein
MLNSPYTVTNRFLPSTGIVVPVFRLNPNKATFTPSMTKRAGALFAAAPYVQGKWDATGVPDALLSAGGAVISGDFRTNLDWNQGSVSFFVTPEWAGNDGKAHTIISYSGNRFNIQKNSANSLRFFFGGAFAGDTSISTWVAGTTYHVVLRWDIKNTLNGTNFFCVSIDDVHNFFGTSTGASFANAGWLIGSIAGAVPGDCQVEGLTAYRRPLFDGTFGTDVGNGDEIAAIYNAGTFKDPCEVTGSWDVVFCLPTNGTAGTLVTGTGNAWSHPHASNLLTDGFFQTTAPGGWSEENTPTAVADITGSERIFNWGYEIDTDAVDEGIYQDEAVSEGETFFIRAVAHSDGTSQPRLIAYDQSNTAEIGNDTGTITSTKTAPDDLRLAITIPAGCTTLRVKIIDIVGNATFYIHQTELYPTDDTYSSGDFAGNNGSGTLVNAVLQVGSGTTADGTEVARVTDTSPTLFDPVKLDAVSLTVTPASKANSTEGSGVRVDGRDSLTQIVPEHKMSSERLDIRFKVTPRHAIADTDLFGIATPWLFNLFKDGNNYVRLYFSAPSSIRCEIGAGGTSIIGTTVAGITGIDAGTEYEVTFLYTKNDAVVVTFNGVQKYNRPVAAQDDFTNLTGFTMYWGTSNTGTSPMDAVFAAL